MASDHLRAQYLATTDHGSAVEMIMTLEGLLREKIEEIKRLKENQKIFPASEMPPKPGTYIVEAADVNGCFITTRYCTGTMWMTVGEHVVRWTYFPDFGKPIGD